MKLNDTFLFGKYQIKNEPPWPIEWKIVHQTDEYQIAQTNMIIDLMAFDAAEPDNNDNYSKKSGTNKWQLSNIKQFLNSDQDNWYHPQHQYDAPPIAVNLWDDSAENLLNPYKNHKGFLYFFSDKEKNLLKEFTFTLANPVTICTAKVWLPTITQLTGDSNGFSLNPVYEGTQFKAYTCLQSLIKTLDPKCIDAYNIKNVKYNSFYWTSSAEYGSPFINSVSSLGSLVNDFPYHSNCGIAPCICLPIDFSV